MLSFVAYLVVYICCCCLLFVVCCLLLLVVVVVWLLVCLFVCLLFVLLLAACGFPLASRAERLAQSVERGSNKPKVRSSILLLFNP